MIYAIGDIHGQAEMLDRALELIEADGGPEARVIFVGDYTDRGGDSRGVLDRLTQGLDAGRNWHCLRGNHDRMFQRFLEAGEVDDAQIKSGKGWLHPALGGQETLGSYFADPAPGFLHPSGGGVATLLSYEVELRDSATLMELAELARSVVPERHLRFLRDLPNSHREGELFLAHAGIRPGVALEDQVEDDLIWIRQEFLTDPRDHGPLIVHGHTPERQPTAYANRVNTDGGAGYGRPLWPVRFDGREAVLLTTFGTERLLPVES